MKQIVTVLLAMVYNSNPYSLLYLICAYVSYVVFIICVLNPLYTWWCVYIYIVHRDRDTEKKQNYRVGLPIHGK